MDELLAKPNRSPEAPYFFLASMTMIVDALGKKIEDLTTKLEVAEATADITHDFGRRQKGNRRRAALRVDRLVGRQAFYRLSLLLVDG